MVEGRARAERSEQPIDIEGYVYKDRADAAAVLAQALGHFAHRKALVLAIPRGAIPMGYILAQSLGADLDIVPVRKIGAPDNPELALAAIDGDGVITLATGLSRLVDERWVHAEARRQSQVLAERIQRYRFARPEVPIDGRIAIVVDDGLATGATMRAALAWVRRRHPAWLVCAVPTADAVALEGIAAQADERVCPRINKGMFAVSEAYLRFPQVDDDEVIRTLSAHVSGRSSSNRGLDGTSSDTNISAG